MPVDEQTILLALVVIQLQRVIPLLKDTRAGLSRLLAHFKLPPLEALPEKAKTSNEV